MPVAQKDRAQCPEDLAGVAAALRTARKTERISKEDLSINVTTDGKYLCVTGDQTARFQSEAEMLRSMREDERIWLGQGDAILAAYRDARGESTEPKKKSTPAPAGNRSGWEGGWYKVPNVLVDTGLLGVMPLPALRAYLTCHRYAGVTGDFYISHATLAQKIGCRARQKGADAMKRLVSAGLVKIERRGNSAQRASDYRLSPLTERTIKRAREFFEKA